MKKIVQRLGSLVLLVLLSGITVLTVAAAPKETIYNSPYVSFSPDGKAWTTNAGDAKYEWYEEGIKVTTGISSTIRELETGEHYYKVDRTGEIPVGYWEVAYRTGLCIHNAYYSGEDKWHGIDYRTEKCLEPYYSGWYPYCADCGEQIVTMLFYMSDDAAESIDYLSVGEGLNIYYYLCPHCTNLEQGSSIAKHECNAISWNRYKVQYNVNTLSTHDGYMEDSIHYYNNATEYEGEPVTPETHLRKNTYSIRGYVFTGWNTEPDGSGKSYADEEEIFNLTTENWRNGQDQGIVALYAQWERSTSTLRIEPNGGTYQGNASLTTIVQDYDSFYAIDNTSVVAPEGYTVSFEANGGEAVEAIPSTQHFTEWSMLQPFAGRMKNDRYFFIAPNGNTDTIRANYTPDPITLPETTRPGYSFGGWYYDEAFSYPAGVPGETIIPDKDMTLYAQWVDLKLTAENNYTTNSRKGAVNLSWTQADNRNKSYLLYQSTDGENWNRINTAEDISSEMKVEKAFDYTGKAQSYTIPYTGFYTLTAEGAQGGSYGSYKGGKGGSVNGKFWLQKGEVITCTIGGQDGYNGGGAATLYGNGGGCTVISSDKKGTLLIAGGGGGAIVTGDGGAGGSSASVLSTGTAGAGGVSGGGAGYRGGTAGSATFHTHSGNVYNKGGCYTVPDFVICGGSLNYWSDSWGCWSDDGDDYCDQCGGLCGGPQDTGDNHGDDGYTCSKCGAEYNGGGTCTRKIGGYALGCNYKAYASGEQVVGNVVSARQSYGGSNYVNTTYCKNYGSKPGIRTGNGSFTLESGQIGYQESLELKGVAAPDKAAPDAISLSTVEKEPARYDRVTITWAEPSDNGTDYYHVAESYLNGSDTPLCRSNITLNTLTTGVCGYYVLRDNRADTKVTATNGKWQSLPGLTTDLTEEASYLHVAPMDVAGNVGETTHIRIGSLEGAEGVLWKLYTEQLVLDMAENIFPAENAALTGADKTYYVRSDGVTPFTLHYGAYMDGAATKEYQPNHVIFESETKEYQPSNLITETETKEYQPENLITEPDEEAVTAKNIFTIPSEAVQAGEISISVDKITYTAVDRPYLVRDSYTAITRKDKNSRLEAVQTFTLPQEASGKEIKVIPIVGADYRGETTYSDHVADAANGLTLIGDGEAPVITGLDILEDKELIDRREGSIHLHATATDALSGVKDFYIRIYNTDNVIEQIYTPDADGIIRIEITADEPIFSGDFTVTAYAVDNVGNERIEEYLTTEFSLETSVERILEPHDPIFQCGESGILTITTWGYADRVEVKFPAAMTALDETLNKVYTYTDTPRYRQQEELQFMVPLYTPENEAYEITVRAYKDGKELEEHPDISIITVNGTVLDDFRTRLR